MFPSSDKAPKQVLPILKYELIQGDYLIVSLEK